MCKILLENDLCENISRLQFVILYSYKMHKIIKICENQIIMFGKLNSKQHKKKYHENK